MLIALLLLDSPALKAELCIGLVVKWNGLAKSPFVNYIIYVSLDANLRIMNQLIWLLTRKAVNHIVVISSV